MHITQLSYTGGVTSAFTGWKKLPCAERESNSRDLAVKGF